MKCVGFKRDKNVKKNRKIISRTQYNRYFFNHFTAQFLFD